MTIQANRRRQQDTNTSMHRNFMGKTSPMALFGLSKLSVWWLRPGIDIERIKPGNPQQNGRHER